MTINSFFFSQEGTDVESYDSVESSRNPAELSPIFPFLLWVTNDFKGGKIYLKIDRRFLLVGSDSMDAVVKAIALSVKAQHIFDLEYHPYLKSFYEYIEYVLGVKPQPSNSVIKFISAIRQLSLSK